MAEEVDGDMSDTGSWLTDLFRRERPRAVRLLRRDVPDADDAADVMQDAFERLAALRLSDRPRTPEAYLRRVIRNLVTDRARRALCRPWILVELDELQVPEARPDQEQILMGDDLLRRYRIALSELTERTREVFLLHRVDEMTYSQIAHRLGISVATVEYHMSRALAYLDEALRR